MELIARRNHFSKFTANFPATAKTFCRTTILPYTIWPQTLATSGLCSGCTIRGYFKKFTDCFTGGTCAQIGLSARRPVTSACHCQKQQSPPPPSSSVAFHVATRRGLRLHRGVGSLEPVLGTRLSLAALVRPVEWRRAAANVDRPHAEVAETRLVRWRRLIGRRVIILLRVDLQWIKWSK